MFDLTDKTAWVTGSARNLGKSMVQDLAEQGANVIVSNRSNTNELEQTASELRDEFDVQVASVQLDIADEESVVDAVDEIHSTVGGIDIFVSNAAVRPHESLEEITTESWNDVLQTNLTGAFFCVREVLPDMKESGWGRIITVSGIDAFFGKPQRLHTVTTKSGIIGFTRALAQEYAEYEITCNCVVPGVFRTKRDPNWHPDPEVLYEGRRKRIPLGRIGQPEEFSPTVVFLASEEAGYITGQVIHVNGGQFPTTRDPTELDLEGILEN